MEHLDNYIVSLINIKNQDNNFNYEITNDFFECFDYGDIKEGAVDCNLDIIKENDTYTFLFHFEGKVKVTCDRCLDEFDYSIKQDYKLFVKQGNYTNEDAEDIVILSFEENEINISQYIYEYIHLALPLQKIHPDDKKGKSTCNAEMLKKIEELSQQEESNNQEIDPRWDVLKKMNFN